MQRIILGLGTGCCGLDELAALLSAQHDADVTKELRPLLPWWNPDREKTVLQRLAVFRGRTQQFVGDAASFYLPYVEEFLKSCDDIRVVCLHRPRDAVIEQYRQRLDSGSQLRIDHWTNPLETGWYRDPMRSTCYPKYDSSGLVESIGRYWDEYAHRINRLAESHLDRLRVFPSDALETTDGQQSILSFCGFPLENQTHMIFPPRDVQPEDSSATDDSPMEAGSPERCAVLVPFHREIVPQCQESLRALESVGYNVIRRGGVSTIDTARSQMATQALVDGFEETFWIDSDVSFDVEAVEQLRQTEFPIICGICAKKGKRQLACQLQAGCNELTFGERGGIVEILYGGTGFMLVRRQVYQDIQEKLNLPVCNESFGKGFVPYFQPLIRQHNAGHWYLGEDFSFCERSRQVGYSIVADTRIRLWHHGMYAYSWEDAGQKIKRYNNYRHRRS